MSWTQFRDMHSGGAIKEPPYEEIYIESPKGEHQAIDIFVSVFGHDPTDIACDCCGQNYSIDEYYSLDEASAFACNIPWDYKSHKPKPKIQYAYKQYEITLDEYILRKHVKVIHFNELSGG